MMQRIDAGFIKSLQESSKCGSCDPMIRDSLRADRDF